MGVGVSVYLFVGLSRQDIKYRPQHSLNLMFKDML